MQGTKEVWPYMVVYQGHDKSVYAWCCVVDSPAEAQAQFLEEVATEKSAIKIISVLDSSLFETFFNHFNEDESKEL